MQDQRAVVVSAEKWQNGSVNTEMEVQLKREVYEEGRAMVSLGSNPMFRR